MPDVYMIGGANGSGKTTAALTFLSDYIGVFEFVNADEIARGINPLKPETADISAGRVMIERLHDLTQAKKNFAFETTCAGTHHVQTLKNCRNAGYRLNLIYLWLPSAEIAIERVETRVREGGHSIPNDTIRRRYTSGIANAINTYLPIVDTALFMDNSNRGIKTVIAEKRVGYEIKIRSPDLWGQMLNIAKGVK